jgi:PAS domain S-box-containing protein
MLAIAIALLGLLHGATAWAVAGLSVALALAALGTGVLVAAQRATRAQVAGILESVTDAFVAVDREWRFIYVNREAEQLLQRPRTGLLGRNLWTEFPAAVGAVFEREYLRAMAEQVPVQFEAPYAPLGVWFEVRAYPSADSLSIYFHDVTARKLAEQEIRESERNFRALANTIPQLAWMADPQGWIFWYSDRWYAYTGATPEEMQGWGWQKVHHPEHVDRVVRSIRHAFDTGEPWDDTFPLRSRTGEYRWFLSRAVPIRDDAGTVLRWFGTNTDVTDQRRAQEALRESEERFRALAENATTGILVIDQDSRIEFANPAVERTFGYPAQELVGQALDLLMPEDQRALHHAGMRRYLETSQRRIAWEGTELPGLTRDGRRISLEISFGEFVRAGRHYFTGIVRDISERKLADEALRESEERHRLLTDMIPQHIWATDPDGFHTYFSRRWYEFTGADPEQSRGEGWLQRLHPDDRDRTRTRWQHSLRTGEPYAIEYRFRGRDGRYAWFLGQAMPLRDAAGRIVKWFGTLTDISDRKQLEQERERRLRQEQEARAESERRRRELERVTESRASLMRGFGHDVKNPLGTAHLHAELLERGKLPGDLSPRQQDSIHLIGRSIRTALQLIDDLLELAQAEAGQLELACVETDVAEVAREAAEDFRQQAAAARMDLAVRMPGRLQADTDPVRLRQILGNLLSNAIKYAPNARLEVVAERCESGGPGPGPWVAVTVADTGPGIPRDKQEFIFREYARLDPGAAQGAGIGLSISRRFARLMGGDLTVASAVGRGSSFTVWLPPAALQRTAGMVRGAA